MGLLDDAIREHLDLKRRRGADPTEVDQLERDALGPVRRGAQVQDQTLQEEERFEDVEHESGNAVLYDDQAGEGFADGPAPPPEPDFIDAPRESFREHESERSWSHDSDDWDGEEPLEPERPVAPEQPVAEAPESKRRPPEPVEPPEGAVAPSSEETIEYDVEAEHAESSEGEDVLEETPEFLQDTPDHDRLWFEQRPPKDFNFDD
jgi:hypothetical protein